MWSFVSYEIHLHCRFGKYHSLFQMDTSGVMPQKTMNDLLCLKITVVESSMHSTVCRTLTSGPLRS